jgi:tetratricopeptide (TPR) repeat protein
MQNNLKIWKCKNIIISYYLIITLFTSCAGVLTGSSAIVEFEKGLNLFNRGKYDEASSHFIKATELDPDYTNAYIYLGRSYINLKQWYSALHPLRTAYRISPDKTKTEVSSLLIDTLFALVIGEIRIGNFDQSKVYISEYLQLNKSLGNSNNQIVSFLITFAAEELKKGNLTNTISALKLALNIDPHNSDAYIGLGRAYFKDGRIFDVLNNIRKAILLDPNNKEAQSLFNQYSN